MAHLLQGTHIRPTANLAADGCAWPFSHAPTAPSLYLIRPRPCIVLPVLILLFALLYFHQLFYRCASLLRSVPFTPDNRS